MQKLRDAIDRQMEWQRTMNSDTETMYLAWVEELGELVASMGYADWKKTERDEHNLVIEAVDLIIFTINLAYYAKVPIATKTTMPQALNDVELVYALLHALNAQAFGEVIDLLITYFPTALDTLVAKQALNALRQNHGYKTGDYIKQWPKGEDNIYLDRLIGLDYDDIYLSLEDIYATKVKAGRLL